MAALGGLVSLRTRLYQGLEVTYSHQKNPVSPTNRSKIISKYKNSDAYSLYLDTKNLIKEHYSKALKFGAAAAGIGLMDSVFAVNSFPSSVGVGDNIYQTSLIGGSIAGAYLTTKDNDAKGYKGKIRDLIIKGSMVFPFLVATDYVSASAQEGKPLTSLPEKYIEWRVPNLDGTWMEGAVSFVNSSSIFFPGFTHGYDWLLFPILANAGWRLGTYVYNNRQLLKEEMKIALMENPKKE